MITLIRISTPHWNQIFWVMFFYLDLLNEHSQLIEQQGKYHFHVLHRHLNVSWEIIADRTSLHKAKDHT